MTLDEVIIYCEKVAKENEQIAFDLATTFNRETINSKECKKSAEDHRQLAGWLKDYKRLLDQKPCEDCISRQAVKEEMIKYGFHAPDMTVTEFVEDLPPVTSQPKTGHWIVLKDEYGDIHECICSNCNDDGNHKWKYCQNCGAKMIESQESEDKK